MEKAFYRIFPYVCIAGFFLYWTGIFILAMPSNYAKGIITNKAPRFKSMFGTTWKLFTPPNTFNDRLYFIVRNIATPDKADTIEVLEDISLQKQRHAPFNQKETVIDHLVNNNVISLKITVWNNNKMFAKKAGSGKADSSAISYEKAQVAFEKRNDPSLATLRNYATMVLKEKKIDTTGKEIKIVIMKKDIPPFNRMNDTSFLQKETLYFETPYKPFN